MRARNYLLVSLSITSGMVKAEAQQESFLQQNQESLATTGSHGKDNAHGNITPSGQTTNEQEAMPIEASTSVYFGYGSNLWLDQMQRRCPNSTYLGVALLHDFRWMISTRGYANIVTPPTEHQDVVYGLVYRLTRSDEARLDRNEDVPRAYIKEMLPCDFWPANGTTWTNTSDTAPETRAMLAYINRNDIVDAAPKDEYIERMNMGINDAVAMGIPEDYIRKYLRPFIPALGMDKNKGYAPQQALRSYIEE